MGTIFQDDSILGGLRETRQGSEWGLKVSNRRVCKYPASQAVSAVVSELRALR